MAVKSHVFVYRWGTNPEHWGGSTPDREAALSSLKGCAAQGDAKVWPVGPQGPKTPKYARMVHNGDVILFFAGAKFRPHNGIYGIGIAGKPRAPRDALAVDQKHWHLPFTWLPGSRPLSATPWVGFDDLLSPQGGGSTLHQLKRTPHAITKLIDWARHPKVATRPKELRLPKKAKAAGDAGEIARLLAKVPGGEQQRLRHEVEQAIRSGRLRPDVLKLWGPKCAACHRKALQADPGNFEFQVAHVREVSDHGTDDVTNTIPLCRLHHWAFDAYLWAVDPKTWKIRVAKQWRKLPAIGRLHGHRLARPKVKSQRIPSRNSVGRRWKLFLKRRP